MVILYKDIVTIFPYVCDSGRCGRDSGRGGDYNDEDDCGGGDEDADSGGGDDGDDNDHRDRGDDGDDSSADGGGGNCDDLCKTEHCPS